MRMLFDVIVALLASYGLLSATWLVIGLVGRRKVRGVRVQAVIYADTVDVVTLRQALSSMKWLAQWGLLDIRSVIATEAVTPKIEKTAARFAAQIWQIETVIKNTDDAVQTCVYTLQ